MKISGTFVTLLSLAAILFDAYVVCDSIFIGAIFDDEDEYKRAFEFALEDINNKATYSVTLNPLIEVVSPNDAFEASSAACKILISGALGIFGPSYSENVEAVQSVCNIKEMPHILTKWKSYKLLRGNSILNLAPDPRILAKAYIDIIQGWKWTEFTVLYENEESSVRLMSLLRYATKLNMHVVLRQLDRNKTGIYRTMLRDVRSASIKNIMLDCAYENLQEVLHQAQQIGMMSEGYNFFITNLDLHTLPLDDYKFSSVNILGIRLVSPDSELVKEVSKEFLPTDDEIEKMANLQAWKMRVDMALVIDAVNMYVSTLNELNLETYALLQDLACNSSDSWKDGTSVVNLMKTNVFNGLTGEIKFDNDGVRSEFQLEVIELKAGGIYKVGKWNSSANPRIETDKLAESQIFNDEESLRNRTFRVEICLTEPYAMWRNSPNNLQGNDQYEGYAIDLIKMLSELEGFKYEFIVRADSDNGGKNPLTGEWGGMIGDLLDNKTDLAIADLTITSEREEAVDFTDAFMNLGISILFEKAKKAPPSFFSFAEPFSYDTWGTLLLSVVVVALSYFIVARISGDEWTSPDPCKDDPDFLTNQFNMKNSFWFTVASLMQQGTEIAPIGIATRTLTGAWWFFILIIVASYTANLTAFLSTEKPEYLFKSLEELVAKAEELGITYGAKKGGATYKFFNSSSNKLYKSVFDYMTEHSENMMTENKLGVERAEQERYAFFMESTSIEYATQRHCELSRVGDVMDPNKGYAIAIRKNSSYRKRLNLAILQLQSQGRLEILKKKWWEERRGGGQCKDDDSQAPEATPLYISNVQGVFYCTVYGIAFSVVLAFLEWLFSIITTARRLKITYIQAFITELKFFMNFEVLVKPLKPQSSSKSDASSKQSVGSVMYSIQYKSRSRFKFGSRATSICRSRSRSKSKSISHSRPVSISSSRRSRLSSKSKRLSTEMKVLKTSGGSSPMRYGFKGGPSQERLTENME